MNKALVILGVSLMLTLVQQGVLSVAGMPDLGLLISAAVVVVLGIAWVVNVVILLWQGHVIEV